MALPSIAGIASAGSDHQARSSLSPPQQVANCLQSTPASIDTNLSCVLQIFQSHLPDPDQELFIEKWRNTKSFTNFQQLPTDLRIMIWPFTYPVYSGQRRVRFGPVVRIEKSNGIIHDSRRRKVDPLPVSLYVNAESRFEILRDFCIVHQTPPPGHRKPIKPLHFRSAEDPLILHGGFLFHNHPHLPAFMLQHFPGGIERLRSFKRFLLEQSSEHPAHLAKVKHLELDLHHIWIDPRSLRSLFNKNAQAGEIMEGDPFFYSAAIFQFPGLEYLCIRYLSECDFGFQDILNDLKAFLEENKHRFKSGKPPKVEAIAFDENY